MEENHPGQETAPEVLHMIEPGDTISVVHKDFVAICEVKHVRLKGEDAGLLGIFSAEDAPESAIGHEATIVAAIERAVKR